MRYLRLTVAYDGTNYSGWQSQINAVSVQQTLEKAIARVTAERIRVTGSGRTDAGVHALGQIVSLKLESELPCETLLRALNANLPDDVVVRRVEEAPAGFHPIRGAKNKRYRYLLYDSPIRDVFLRTTAWHVHHPLDVVSMIEAARCLVGRHDFASFMTKGSKRTTTVRTITDLFLLREHALHGEQIRLEVAADGFLYNMVRIIVGTLVEVGRGKQPVEWVAEVLAACDRTAAGPTAPPEGLCLMQVDYEW